MSDESLLPSDQQEDLEDLGEAGRHYTAVINQVDWTTQTNVEQNVTDQNAFSMSLGVPPFS